MHSDITTKISNKDNLETLLLARHPLIYINNFDFQAVDLQISEACRKAFDENKNSYAIREYCEASGDVDFITKVHGGRNEYLVDSLNNLYDFLSSYIALVALDKPTVVVLREIHEFINKSKIYSALQSIVHKIKKDDESGVNRFILNIIIVDSKLEIPPELEKLITVWEVSPPSKMRIKELILKAVKDNTCTPIDDNLLGEITAALNGLSEYEIHQILNYLIASSGDITRAEIALIHGQKRQAIKKSGLLEMVEPGDIQIGGLKRLTAYLKKDQAIFSNPGMAEKFGITAPSGILIVGMPGCGKSLTAKYVAQQFGIPLLRLDIGRLLGKYVGESEENFRRAIRIAESASPCVLWIDEIEKAFAGVGADDGGGSVATRLFGNFLTWMQENKTCTYVVATANDIERIPPEFLRKGRFDEIFRISFPNIQEREEIFKIQLYKHAKTTSMVSKQEITELATMLPDAEKFSGADIESIITQAIKNVFVSNIAIGNDGWKLTFDDVRNVIKNKDTHSSYRTQEAKLTEMQKKLDLLKITSAT